MSKIQVPTHDQVDSKAQEIFADLNKKLGMVPNLYATIGHSSNALASYLAFSGAQANGSFNAKEREALLPTLNPARARDSWLEPSKQSTTPRASCLRSMLDKDLSQAEEAMLC